MLRWIGPRHKVSSVSGSVGLYMSVHHAMQPGLIRTWGKSPEGSDARNSGDSGDAARCSVRSDSECGRWGFSCPEHMTIANAKYDGKKHSGFTGHYTFFPSPPLSPSFPSFLFASLLPSSPPLVFPLSLSFLPSSLLPLINSQHLFIHGDIHPSRCWLGELPGRIWSITP